MSTDEEDRGAVTSDLELHLLSRVDHRISSVMSTDDWAEVRLYDGRPLPVGSIQSAMMRCVHVS